MEKTKEELALERINAKNDFREQLKAKKKTDKFTMLDDCLLDEYLVAAEFGELDVKELSGVASYLKNNNIVQNKKVHSESELIDGLVEK